MLFQNIIFYIYTLCLLLSLISGITAKKTKIIGGTDAEITDFPYHASFKRVIDYFHVCGGAIITNKHILTAAHCVTPDIMNYNLIMVYLGKSMSQFDNYESIFAIEEIYSHPEFFQYEEEETDFAILLNDIAVIKIEGTIIFNEFQNKINLPTRDIFIDDLGILSGWGSKSYPEYEIPDKIQRTWMTTINDMSCSFYAKFNIHPGQFCALQRRGVGACIGDSGSPLVNEDKIIGITSMCRLCATGIPDIFTRIYHYIDFINSVVAL